MEEGWWVYDLRFNLHFLIYHPFYIRSSFEQKKHIYIYIYIHTHTSFGFIFEGKTWKSSSQKPSRCEFQNSSACRMLLKLRRGRKNQHDFDRPSWKNRRVALVWNPWMAPGSRLELGWTNSYKLRVISSGTPIYEAVYRGLVTPFIMNKQGAHLVEVKDSTH